jgi:hypothetical protein
MRLNHVVDGIAAAAAYSDHFDSRASAGRLIVEGKI